MNDRLLSRYPSLRLIDNHIPSFNHITNIIMLLRGKRTKKKMDGDVDSSFHRSLSRFAYVPRGPSLGVTVPSASASTSPESSLSSHNRTSRTHTDSDTAAVQPRNGIPFSNVLEADGAGDGALSSSLASKRKARETTEKQRARRGSKRRNERGKVGRVDPGEDSCTRLKGIPDHVAKDLDGALRPPPPPHPHYVLG